MDVFNFTNLMRLTTNNRPRKQNNYQSQLSWRANIACGNQSEKYNYSNNLSTFIDHTFCYSVNFTYNLISYTCLVSVTCGRNSFYVFAAFISPAPSERVLFAHARGFDNFNFLLSLVSYPITYLQLALITSLLFIKARFILRAVSEV